MPECLRRRRECARKKFLAEPGRDQFCPSRTICSSKLVLADVDAEMLANLSRGEQQAHAEAIHADIVADGCEVLHAFANQGANKVFRDAAQTEAADHDGRAIEKVAGWLHLHWRQLCSCDRDS